MVAEPAGVVALAALLARAVQVEEGKQICAVITGGNVDLNLIDRILQFGLGATGRHLRLRTQLTDRPGSLARLAALLAEQGANIFEVVHHRVGSSLSVNEVDLELTLEVRDHTHGDAVLQALKDNGYHTDVIRGPRTHHLLGPWKSGS